MYEPVFCQYSERISFGWEKGNENLFYGFYAPKKPHIEHCAELSEKHLSLLLYIFFSRS